MEILKGLYGWLDIFEAACVVLTIALVVLMVLWQVGFALIGRDRGGKR